PGIRRRMRHGVRTTGADAPEVHQARLGRVYGALPGGLVDEFQLGGVLYGVAVGRHKVTEGVVAGLVAARPPAHVDAFTAQARDAAHHRVKAAHVVGDVVEARRPGQDGDAVMPFVAAQETHEVAQPVTDAETQY